MTFNIVKKAEEIGLKLDRSDIESDENKQMLFDELKGVPEELQYDVRIDLARVIEAGRSWNELDQGEQDFVIFLTE